MVTRTGRDADADRPAGGPEELPGRPPASLTSLLRQREEVARCSGALAASRGTTVAAAEVLLLSEARRRGVPVGLLAHRVLTRRASVGGWRAERCAVCGEDLQVEVLGDYGLARALVCPDHRGGHGQP